MSRLIVTSFRVVQFSAAIAGQHPEKGHQVVQIANTDPRPRARVLQRSSPGEPLTNLHLPQAKEIGSIPLRLSHGALLGLALTSDEPIVVSPVCASGTSRVSLAGKRKRNVIDAAGLS